MRRIQLLVVLGMLAFGSAAFADVIDPEPGDGDTNKGDDDGACSVVGVASDATPVAPLLVGFALVGLSRRRRE